MAKGFFTQSAVILLSSPPDFQQIETALSSFSIGKTTAKETDNSWMGGSLSLTLIMREEVNGLVVVDLIEKPWPDAMGNPNGSKDEIDIFGAWTMGFFGPHIYPGNLTRIVEQKRVSQELEAAASEHTAFLRIKSSYVLGAGPEVKVLPEDYDPLAELYFVTDVAKALLKLPQALAYFNPNGEVLCDADRLENDLKRFASLKLPPLPLWSAVRLYSVDDEWKMMDSVGMEQFDVRDSEACFSKKKQSADEVSRFLWNIGDYLRQKGPVIKNGDTMNGPGNVNWKAAMCPESLCAPPRRTLRWFPLDGTRAPKELIPRDAKASK